MKIDLAQGPRLLAFKYNLFRWSLLTGSWSGKLLTDTPHTHTHTQVRLAVLKVEHQHNAHMRTHRAVNTKCSSSSVIQPGFHLD